PVTGPYYGARQELVGHTQPRTEMVIELLFQRVPGILRRTHQCHAPVDSLGQPERLWNRLADRLLNLAPTPSGIRRNIPGVITVPETLAVEALRPGRFEIPPDAGVDCESAGQLDIVLNVGSVVGLERRWTGYLVAAAPGRDPKQ